VGVAGGSWAKVVKGRASAAVRRRQRKAGQADGDDIVDDDDDDGFMAGIGCVALGCVWCMRE